MYSRVHSFYEAHTGNKNYAQLAACSDARNFRLCKIRASPSLMSTRTQIHTGGFVDDREEALNAE